jgi:hypothetical protein
LAELQWGHDFEVVEDCKKQGGYCGVCRLQWGSPLESSA